MMCQQLGLRVEDSDLLFPQGVLRLDQLFRCLGFLLSDLDPGVGRVSWSWSCCNC